MNISEIKHYRSLLEAEEIDLAGVAEIDHAYSELKNSGVELRDDPENALAADMLDELEENRPLVERRIYDWVEKSFGESEAQDPSWNIALLAAHINDMQVIFGAEEGTLAHLLGEK